MDTSPHTSSHVAQQLGTRIQQARHLRGRSLRDLGELAQLSAQAISKYERGENLPTSATLLRLAKALDLSIDCFFRSAEVSDLKILSSEPSTARAQEMLRAQVRSETERSLEIELLLGAQARVELPELEGAPEEAAWRLREIWDLGTAPLFSMTDLLEQRGIRVVLVDLDTAASQDAWACLAQADETIPILALRRDLRRRERRIAMARELACLLGIEESARARFARAFLIPPDVARNELGARRTALHVDELEELSTKHGFGPEQWIRRAEDLEILSPSRIRAIERELRAPAAWVAEPAEGYPAEEPSRDRRLVLQALAEDILTEKRAAELLGRPLTAAELALAGRS